MDNKNTSPAIQEFPQHKELIEAIEGFRSKNLRLLTALEQYSAIPQYSVSAPLSEMITNKYTAITTNRTGGFDGKLE